MGIKAKDMTGQRFGRLIVIDRAHTIKERILWNCICDCGKNISIYGMSLRNGDTRSCGCLKIEKSTRHGMTNKPIYNVWNSMLRRCLNKKNTSYMDYGGRGITVCERWLKFENFMEDMGERPDGLTIDRRDNNKGYSPDNCYWATKTQQGNNTRVNVFLEYKGTIKTMAEWSRIIGMTQGALRSYIRRGWSMEKVVMHRNIKIKETA